MSNRVVHASKFLALILRHRPEVIGITLDPEGWADIEEIILKSGGKLNRDLIDQAVRENNKKRFAVSEDDKRIRANQGHSLKDVDLKFEPVEPPDVLYHGTSSNAIRAINVEGLRKMSRQHVHLSQDIETAYNVGGRHGGSTFVLGVDAKRMYLDDHQFFLSENGVWLTDSVPRQYLTPVDLTDLVRKGWLR